MTVAKVTGSVFAVIIGSAVIMPPLTVQTGGSSELAAKIARATLSPLAEVGRQEYANHCAACHGYDANGTEFAPPLLQPKYMDWARQQVPFHQAVKRGVPEGSTTHADVPEGKRLHFNSVERIAKYLRELQRHLDS